MLIVKKNIYLKCLDFSINTVLIYLYPDPKEIRKLTFSISRFCINKGQPSRVNFLKKKSLLKFRSLQHTLTYTDFFGVMSLYFHSSETNIKILKFLFLHNSLIFFVIICMFIVTKKDI